MILRLYALTLRLFPRSFRERYAAEMLEAARLDLAASRHRLRTFATLEWDAVTSAFRENIRTPQPIALRHVLFAAALVSVWLPIVCIVNQQKLRRGADRQPQQIAELIAAHAAEGPSSVTFTAPIPSSNPNTSNSQLIHAAPGAITISSETYDIASPAFLSGASTFTAIYDASGHPLAANATLNGALPQPPRGIFNTILHRGEFKVSWQPRPGIRVALTGLPLPTGGFVLAGQSLLPSESSHARFVRAMQSLWLALSAALLLLLIALLLKRQRNAATR